MNKMQFLTEIIRKENTYQLRFEIPETKEVQFSHPVFTNVDSMTGKVGTSKTLKATSTKQKTFSIIQIEEVDELEAKYYHDIAKNGDMIESIEIFEFAKGWIVRIKK